METTAIFVLGALCGLVLMVLVYTFIGMLKAKSQIETNTSEIDALTNNVFTYNDDHWRKHNDLEHDLSQRMDRMEEDGSRSVDELNTIISREVQDLYSYIDSRIDKATSKDNKTIIKG